MKCLALSHIGLVRPGNEDRFYLPREGESFAVVCDGMGGHQAGEVASQTAIDAFAARLREAGELDEDELRQAVIFANREVLEMSERNPGLAGMGTTLTAIWWDDAQFMVGHVGDSRAYLFRDDALTQVTKDHSWVQELVDAGEITAKQARVHPQRNIITRSVGTQRGVNADVTIDALRPDDCFLLCSDGLTNYVEDEEIAHVLHNGLSRFHEQPASEDDAGGMSQSLDELLGMAIMRGGSDNITVVLLVGEGAMA